MRGPLNGIGLTAIAAVSAGLGIMVGCTQAEPKTAAVYFEMHSDKLRRACVAQDSGSSGLSNTVVDFRMYVSEFMLIDSDGQRVPFRLADDPPWQNGVVALLDFVSTRHCNDAKESREFVVGRAPKGQYTGIEFTVGVPFELNHINPLTAEPPLNISSMFWSWQLGYKFLRLDLANIKRSDPQWSFHLGSTGCKSSSAVRAPDQPCLRPNRIRIELSPFDSQNQKVVVDLDALVAEQAWQGGKSCMGLYHESTACTSVLKTVSLDASTGSSFADDTVQTVFQISSLTQ